MFLVEKRWMNPLRHELHGALAACLPSLLVVLRRSIVVVMTFAAAHIGVARLYARQAPCDPRLKPVPGPTGYAQRDATRCEGLYQQPVAAVPQLMLAALWDGPPTAAVSDPLSMSWPAGMTGRLSIVATGLNARDYYRMDAFVDAAAGAYAWPLKNLRDAGLRQTEVGILIFREAEDRTYLPAVLSGGSRSPSGYRLVVIPSADLAELTTTVRAISGSFANSTTHTPPLGFYSAASPIRLQLPQIPPGTYRVTLAARARDAGSSGALTFVMYAR